MEINQIQLSRNLIKIDESNINVESEEEDPEGSAMFHSAIADSEISKQECYYPSPLGKMFKFDSNYMNQLYDIIIDL